MFRRIFSDRRKLGFQADSKTVCQRCTNWFKIGFLYDVENPLSQRAYSIHFQNKLYERKNKREQKVHIRKSKQIFRFPPMKISLRCCCQAFGCTGRSETETLICTEGLRGEIETELECGQSTMYGRWKIAQKL